MFPFLGLHFRRHSAPGPGALQLALALINTFLLTLTPSS